MRRLADDRTYCYPVELAREPGAVNVNFPDLSGCLTYGKDRASALDHATEALELWLETTLDLRQPLPAPSPARGRPLVAGRVRASARP